ncbi:MAG: VCBS repeat-containing protein, partial [Pseudoxanthomonas sp.]
PLGSNHTAALAVGDFNADGRGDLVLDEARDAANLRLYVQDSQGSLGSSLDISRNRGSGVLLAADLDRDGRTDIAMAHSGWSYIGYYLQTSTGFTPETIINANQNFGRANYFAAGDLNHDGCGDLVVSRWSQSPVLLYGQGCVRPRIADCRLPPFRVEGSTVTAAGPVSPLMGEHNGDVGASVTESVARGAGNRGRNGYDVPPLRHKQESR